MEKQDCSKKNYTKGSLTVEAALVLPIFFFAVLSFLYFFQILEIQAQVQSGLFKAARTASEYAFLYGDLKKNGPDPPMKAWGAALYYKQSFQSFVDRDWLNHTCIEGGIDGIRFTGSTFMEKEEAVDIVVSYSIRLPVPFFHFGSLNMKQSCLSRGFVGQGGEDEQGSADTGEGEADRDYVYVTETGAVYHKSRECTHIQLSIRSAGKDELKGLRNEGGGRYKRCRLCSPASSVLPKQCYITTDGDRYHASITCSGLKRTVMKIRRKDAGDRRPCTRCAG